MPITFADLITTQTLADVRATFSAAASVVGWAVDQLPPLARLRKLADTTARTIWALTEVQAQAIRGGFRDFASGVQLEALAEQVYGLEGGRITETFATTTIAFTNPDATPYVFVAGEVEVGNAVTGKTYKAAAFELAAFGFPGANANVDVIAVEPGSGSNADPGDITVMVTTFGGVTCTNPGAAVAVDDETDDALRIRAQAQLAQISKSGAALAYESIALNAKRPDGTPIGITKVKTPEHVPNMGDVTVYLADGDGAPAGADVTLIDAEIRERVLPVGVSYIGTFAATNVPVDIEATLLAYASAGLSASEIEAVATQALIDLFASPMENPIGGIVTVGPGGTLYQDKIKSVMEQIESNGMPLVFTVSIALPAGNVALDPGEVATLGTLTLTVTLF